MSVRDEREWGCCFCDFYELFTFLFVWMPLRVPVLFSISRKKSLILLYISICFVVIWSQLARPERCLNWDIFSWKMWYPYYYSPTKEAQREMNSTYYNGHYNYQHVLCTYYMPGTMLSFYRIKGVILSMRVWRRFRIIHISHFDKKTEAGQICQQKIFSILGVEVQDTRLAWYVSR